MSLRVNYNAFSGIFAVPTELVDRHIKLAGSSALKVVLFLLRHSQAEIEKTEIAAATGVPESEVSDALEYWIAAGIIRDESAGVDFELIRPSEREEEKPQQRGYINDSGARIVTSSPPRPDRKEVAARIGAEPKLKFLLDEAELKLGRNLTHSDAASLISLHDWAGMQWDVLMMLIVFCTLSQKNSMRAIEKEAIHWVDLGIDTMEKAEGYILEADRLNTAEKSVRAIFGIRDRNLTTKEKAYIKTWMIDWNTNPELLIQAYDRCIDNVGALKFTYINSILESWKTKGIKNVKDIEKLDGKKSKDKGQNKTSIDMDLVENNYLHVIPKYRERKG